MYRPVVNLDMNQSNEQMVMAVKSKGPWRSRDDGAESKQFGSPQTINDPISLPLMVHTERQEI